MHVVANNSRCISAALVLKSSEIRAHDGLGHLLEHTSFVGAAGTFAASEIKEMHQDCFQETDAFTQPGMIQWRVSFLPKHLEQGLGVLAITSLGQKFDVETVASEARVCSRNSISTSTIPGSATGESSVGLVRQRPSLRDRHD